jgi:molybdopterin/thiamine biosynthesis adenylyltransferase
VSFEPWFIRDSRLLDSEVAAISDSEFDFDVDETARAAGVIVLRGHLDGPEGRVAAELIYPFSFPYGRPEVRVEIRLGRHSSPYRKSLCLWPDAEDPWDWDEQFGQQGLLMLGQATALLALQNDPDELERRSEKVPDRQGRHFFDQWSGALLLSSGVGGDVPSGSWGTVEILGLTPAVLAEDVNGIGLVAKLRVFDRTGHLVEERTAPDEWTRLFPDPSRLTAHWVKVNEYPPFRASRLEFQNRLEKWVNAKLPRNDKARYHTGEGWPKKLRIVGAAYPEEQEWSEVDSEWVLRDDWVYVLEMRDGNKTVRQTFRTFNVGDDDYFSRNPRLRPLSEKRCAVVGVGALGSLIATSLCRAGVGSFVLIDHDVVQPGNVVRGSFALSAVGQPKIRALVNQLRLIRPTVAIEGRGGWGGAPDLNELGDYHGDTRSLLSGCDVVVVALADYGLSLDIQEFAADANLPIVYADVNQGAWGGKVFRSGIGACLGCLFTAIRRGEVELPLESSDDQVMPESCDSPTFTGASFDLEAIASLASRFAVQAVTSAGSEYPLTDANLLLWQATSSAPGATPSLETVTLAQDPACSICQ